MTPTIPQNTGTAAPNGLDPTVLNLAKSIRHVESGGDYSARGQDGEVGAYQMTPGFWQNNAPKYGIISSLDTATPQEQNAVAYNFILDQKNKGYNPMQVASVWNSGQPDPNKIGSGTSNGGAAYNVPRYANDVYSAYQTLKSGGDLKDMIASQMQPQQEAPSIGGFARNVVSSGANFIGNLGEAALHPVRTVQELGSIPVGALQELGGQQNQQTQAFDSIVNYFKQRYGGAENLGQTVYKDPIGFLADLSTVFAGGAGALGVAAKGADLAGVADAANVARTGARLAETASDYTNPLTPAIAGVKAAATKIAPTGVPLAAQASSMLTGAGADATQSLFKAMNAGGAETDAATAALRGEISPNAIVDEAYTALDNLKHSQSADYQAGLSKIAGITDQLPIKQSLYPIQDALDAQLQKFGINVTKDGQLDFSRSAISAGTDANKVQTAYETIRNWGMQPSDRTPIGLDTLKRKLGNLFNARIDGKPVSAFLTPLKQSVSKVLSAVPEYDKTMKSFSTAQDLIDELQGTFSMSGKASEDTVFRKLLGTLRSNDPLRVQMLKQLSDAGASNLEAKMAGASFSPYFARGLRGQLVEGAAIFSAMQGLLTPKFIAVALATSPRLMGEFIKVLGATEEQASKFTQVLKLMKELAPAAAITNESQKGLQDSTPPLDTTAPTPTE